MPSSSPHSSPDPILEPFGTLAARRPEHPLVVSPGRLARCGDLDRLAGALAARLEALAGRLPLPPGSLVGLSSPDGAAYLVSYLALRRAGLVPLLLDRRSPRVERLRVATALGAPWTLRCRVPWPQGPEAWSLDGLGGGLELEEGEEASLAAVEATVLAPEVGAVKLTSGSTGAPRGIVVTAEALAADDAGLARTMGLVAADRILSAIPMSHSYGFSSVGLPALVRGSTLVLAKPDSGPYGPLRAARELEATVFPTVPAYLQALLRVSSPPELAASLRLTLTAGAPLCPSTAVRFREVYGRRVHVFYGASECGGIAFDREGTAGERGTVGEPVEGVRVVLEPVSRSGRGGCPEGGGVIAVESPALADGYLPAEPDGGRLAGGRFVSGDLGVWRGDELALAGRMDDLVNIKGKKVNPREVEGVIADLPEVEEVVALGVEDPHRPGTVLLAVVAAPGGRLEPRQVVEWCRGRLADHKVPRGVVMVEAIPRTGRGKVDQAAVRSLARSRSGAAFPGVGSAGLPPRPPT